MTKTTCKKPRVNRTKEMSVHSLLSLGADFKSCVWTHTCLKSGVGKRNKGLFFFFFHLVDLPGRLDTCLRVRTYFATNFCFNQTLTLHALNSPSISLASVVSSPAASGCCTAFWKHPLKVGWHLAQLHWAWLLSGTGLDVSWNAPLASLPQAVVVADTTASNRFWRLHCRHWREAIRLVNQPVQWAPVWRKWKWVKRLLAFLCSKATFNIQKKTTPTRCAEQLRCVLATICLVKRWLHCSHSLQGLSSLASLHVSLALSLGMASLWQEDKFSMIHNTYWSDNIRHLRCTLDDGGHLIHLIISHVQSRSEKPGEDVSSWCWGFSQGWWWEKTAEGRKGSFSLNAGVNKVVLLQICRKVAEGSTVCVFFFFFKGWRLTGLWLTTFKEVCSYFWQSILLEIGNKVLGGFQASGDVLAIYYC